MTEITVSYKPKKNISDAPVILHSGGAAIYLMDGFNRDTMAFNEQFVVMYLNRANKVIGLYGASVVGITGTITDTRLILTTALKVAAVSIVLSHNHRPGNLSPSRADEDLTRKISEAAKLHDIKVPDHIIPDHQGKCYSFADNGLL